MSLIWALINQNGSLPEVQ